MTISLEVEKSYINGDGHLRKIFLMSCYGWRRFEDDQGVSYNREGKVWNVNPSSLDLVKEATVAESSSFQRAIDEIDNRPKQAERKNDGKTDLSFFHPETMEQTCKVWMVGAEKYDRDNWKKLWGDDTVSVVCASALRHILHILKGNDMDAETGLPNSAHVVANMSMLIEHLNKQGKLK